MSNQKVFIITGAQGAGKTTRLEEVVNLLLKNGKSIAGFIAEGTWENGKRNTFTLVDIQSDKTISLCSSEAKESWVYIGRFFFNPQGIASGEKWLEESAFIRPDFVVIDELGMFELEGKVWHAAFKKLLERRNCQIIITVRDRFVDQIIEKFALKNTHVFFLETGVEEIVRKLT